MKRREFIKGLNGAILLGMAGAIPGLTLMSRSAAAAGAPTKFFVLLRMSGGWDVTLGLDPQIQAAGTDQSDMFIEYRPEDIVRAQNIRLAPAAASMAPFARETAIINGVYMSSNNQSHDANLDYISTGDQMGLSADLSVELSNNGASGPFGVIFNSQVKRANRSVMVTSTSDVLATQKSFNVGQLSHVKLSQGHASAFTQARTNLLQNQSQTQKLIELLQQLNVSSLTDPADNFIQNGAVAAACFLSQVANQAQFDISVTLDTHTSHPQTHLNNQKKAWDAIAGVMQLFRNTPGFINGESLFDETTFMVVSEFSRTPALNAGNGKDHNPFTNSVLLAGAGVRGNQMIGRSQLIGRHTTSTGEPRHVGNLVDYRTNQSPRTKAEAKNGNFQFIFPENVAATVAAIQGVDRRKFANVSADIKSLDLIVKS